MQQKSYYANAMHIQFEQFPDFTIGTADAMFRV